MSPRLKEKYEDKVKAELIEQFNLENVMQVGKPVKVVVNMGVGEAARDAKALDGAIADLQAITGQKTRFNRVM